MRPVEEQNIAALAKARGITLEAARAQLATVKSVAVKNPKGH
jgi:hypothetical protein